MQRYWQISFVPLYIWKNPLNGEASSWWVCTIMQQTFIIQIVAEKNSVYFNAFVLWSTLKQPTAAAAALPLPFCCAFVSKRIWPLLLSAQLLLRGWSVQNQNRGWFTFNCQMLLHALPEWIGQTMFSMLLSQIFWETKCMWFNVHRFSDKDDDSTMVVNGIDNMWRWTHIHTTRWDQRLLIKMNITKSYLVDNNDWTA